MKSRVTEDRKAYSLRSYCIKILFSKILGGIGAFLQAQKEAIISFIFATYGLVITW